MNALLVTAYLSNGFSAADRWSPSLDGILAYHHLRLKMGTDEFNLSLSMNEQTTVDDLPVDKVEHDGVWWYACSSPEYESMGEKTRVFYKKFNIDRSMLISQKSKTIELTKGQFKNYSLGFKEVFAKEIKWHIVGDKEEIIKLLNHCNQIGGQRGKGMGLVSGWTIEDYGDAQKATLNRPIPVAAAEHYDISGIKAWRGFRPSVRINNNQCICVLPA